MEKISRWSGNIANHFWYSYPTCNGDIDALKVRSYTIPSVCFIVLQLKDKWFSVLHHVINEHEWLTGNQHCEHDVLTEPPTDNDGRTLPYFNKREASFNALRSLATDRRWLKTLQYYTKFR